VVRKLNDVNAKIQDVRTKADSEIANGVGKINNLLQQYKVVNDAVVRGDTSTSDMADNLDARDKIIKQISEFVGLKMVTRARNDVALYTESGVTLFETVPRNVTFKAASLMTANTSGAFVFIDGVDVTSTTSSMPLLSGSVSGLVKIRDTISLTYQAQIDEFARGLIESFAESPHPGFPVNSIATGLFAYPGSPAVPPAGAMILGLSGSISLNAAVDPAQGGDLTKLRDGGINGAAYVYNTTSRAGYSQRISELVAALDASRLFAPAAGLGSQTSLKAFSSSSAGWLFDLHQKAMTSVELHNAISQRSADALQTKTGVSIDEEMSSMLELERSYQASAKLMTTVDQMLKTLLDAVR
jgi:flagellar hook-associated protein 1